MYSNGLQGVAVIGMAGRFPGAPDINCFWRNIRSGVESITRFSPESVALRSTLEPGDHRVYARGVLDGVDLFDASFFGFTPREAELMDPQHRVFLEVAWEALEHAGYDAERTKMAIGLFAGSSMNTYLLYNLCTSREFIEQVLDNHQVGTHPALLGNDKDFLATRVSYKMGLNGPSVCVQTACSTSLVAVTMAWQSLMSYQCDTALAGGVSISFPQNRSYTYTEGAMVSSDGRCRAFDADAQGMLYGAGAGVVVLKRVEDAMRDGDSIYAVIRGAAINNDGSAKVSYMAPSVDGQAAAVMTAQQLAEVDPASISYIEAHGTGTPLGDPIEIAGLTQAFRAGTDKNQFCAIGSVKTNIGHLEVAAGVAGLIKTILALHHKEIPPSLNFQTPNPKINFASSPFFVNAVLRSWESSNGTRRAGVSSFGVGGTNAHVVVEEAPAASTSGPSRMQQLLVLSAKTESALQAMSANLAAHLEVHPEIGLADAAFTLQRGRKVFAHRRAVVAANATEAGARLRAPEPRTVATGKARAREPSIVFLFPGQGAQYLDMGRELYDAEPVFREAVDRCAQILQGHLGLDLRGVLYPDAAGRDEADSQINQTWVTQPAIFAVEYALARLWMSWGVKPAVLLGHSIGEYVAAVLAEAFTLEDALGLLSVRARLMQALPAGAMLAVRRGAEDVEALLPPGASIAAVNSHALCVVSGPTDVLKEWQPTLEAKGIAAKVLYTSHAFHSAMMDPMLPEFAAVAGKVPSRTPKLPWVSTCTGEWMDPQAPVDGDYWVRQIRRPVRFAAALDQVIEDPRNILLEVGPGQTLTQLARQHAKKPADATVVATLGPLAEPGRDLASMLAALGRLWVAGVGVDWEGFSAAGERRRVPLPTYPFERKRYWVEPAAASKAVAPASPLADDHLPAEPASIKESEMQIVSEVPPTAIPTRKERLIVELCELFQSYSGADHSQTDVQASFIDLGFDSLFLTQAAQGVQKRFGLKVTFRQMLGDLGTLESLAAYLDSKMPPEASPRPEAPLAPKAASSNPAPVVVPAAATAVSNPGQARLLLAAAGGPVESIIQQQMAIMAQQLELLRQAGSVGEAAVPAGPSAPVKAMPTVTAVNLEKQSHFGPFKAIEKGAAGGLTERQQKALETLVARYNRRTAKSKELAQIHRAHFCDPRAAGNFRQLWKEMVYPIVCARSKGSRIWDIDGNEYIDVTMGFGANYLGHSPDFVIQAVEDQMQLGVEIGPQSPIAGEVAQMICEFTGMERATFCNTGSEAVMAAFRVARTVTGREKIVYFYGDYHGVFDEVLGRPAMVDGLPGAMPIAPGIPPLSNVIILEYGNPSSLETIRRHAHEIAGVIVEPVQSRHCDLQPGEFLQELRRLTSEKEIALIFDEVITGFRIAPGGAQEYFGVKADLATYGKVIGGGMPIGVLAGSSTFMDALDGGFWQYGDESSPPAGVTFFAGTFVRHPLAMAAALAVLKYLKSEGPALQQRTNALTANFVNRLNRVFQDRALPMKLQTFTAMFYYDFHSDLKYASLLFYYLRDRGVHIWEGRVGHLSIAHTEQDMDSALNGFIESVDEMQAGGLLPATTATAQLGVASAVASASSQTNSPTTEAQREIFFSVQMGDDANCAYNESTVFHFSGELKVPALEQSLLYLMERHPALRSTFSVDGEQQLFHPGSKMMGLPLTDLSPCPESARDLRFQDMCAVEMRTPFDLVQGPLLRCQLVRLSPEQHKLIFTAHHMVCDGWSFSVIFSELPSAYNAFLLGQRPSFPPAMSFADYALQMTLEQNSEKVRLAEEYWIGQFSSGATALELPVDRPRPPVKSFPGAMESRTFDPDRYLRLKKAAPKLGGTLFSTLLSIFTTLLYRLTGQEDLVVGVPAAGQAIVGQDELVGHCLNFLPLRFNLSNEMVFSDYAKNVKATVLEAYENQDFTYGTLVRKLKLPRDTSRLPLVSAMFNIDRGPGALKLNGIESYVTTNPKQFVNFEIFFNLKQTETELEIECEYNTDLFDRSTIRNWLECYEALIEGVLSQSQSRLGDLPVLGAVQEQMLAEWNQTRRELDEKVTVHELFEEQVKQRPKKIAVRCGDSSLTYADLNHAADTLARRLQAAGIKVGDRVGLFVDRSVDMVSGLMGILKSGAAYVPMDPSFPAERLSFMIEDGQLSAIVTQESLMKELPRHSAQVVLLGQTFSETGRPSALAVARGNDLAYVIYTSGSTGRPKGVQVEHRAVVNFLNSMRREPGLSADDVLLSVTTLSFDIAGLELFLPLVVGATVVVAQREVVIDGNLLRRELEQTSATVMQATPVTWRMLLEAGWAGSKDLKILIGGEAVPRDLVNSLAPLCASIWNMYGPTETTIWSTIYRLAVEEGPVLIGRPIDNTQAYIVSKENKLQPVGVPGELLIGGNGLARGYWNRPELTSEKFIPDPFTEKNGNRLYRTGDLARWRSDGVLECLGRMDFQVKLRGFRIELGEIETALEQHGAVKQAVVSLLTDSKGITRLVGYYSKTPGQKIEDAELRQYLSAKLPDYMVPALFVALEVFPLTPNGKVDRKALPTPEISLSPETRDIVAPRNEQEKLLADIWSQVLGIPTVGVFDSFFELGGDSLLSFRIANRAREAGIPLTPRLFFQHRTIAELIKAVDGISENLGAASKSSLITRVSRDAHKRHVPISTGRN
jgi:amino acid adenylation domain-containing protein